MSIDQTHYIENILKTAKMNDCKPANTPMETHIHLTPLLPEEEGHNIEEYQSIIGALNYAAILIRLDIAIAIGFLTCHIQKPGILHWDALQ